MSRLFCVTPTPAPSPNALARGLLPTTPSPTLDNPCEAIPEPDIPECKDLPAETPEPTPLPSSPAEELQILPFYPDGNTVDTETGTGTDTDTDTDTDTEEEESGVEDEASSEN